MARPLDFSAFSRKMKTLAKIFDKQSVLHEAEGVAHDLLSAAIAAPIPIDDGMLAMSGAVYVDIGASKVVFGFNKEYAAFQDAPGMSPGDIIEIRPVSKKALYIPLSPRGRKDHSAGNKPADEGLEWGTDYVLAQIARIPVKPYGSDVGPNAYFSGTLERRKTWAIAELGRRMQASLGRQLGGK